MPNLSHIGGNAILNLRHGCNYGGHYGSVGGRNLLVGQEVCGVGYSADIPLGVVLNGWRIAIDNLAQGVAAIPLFVGVQQHKHCSIAPLHALRL